MIPGIAAPWMLPWLAATALPALLAALALRHPRAVRFGPIELVLNAARRAHLTRGGVAWPRTLLRCLLVAAATAAAARPFLLVDGGRPPGAGTTRLVAGAADRRIAIVGAAPLDGDPRDDAALAVQRAVEALVAGPRRDRESRRGGMADAGAPPTVDRVPLDAVAGGSAAVTRSGQELVILADGVVPGRADAARLSAAVEAGGAILVCLGPSSLDEAVRPRLAAWLASLGVGVEGTARLDDAAIELAAGSAEPTAMAPWAEATGDGFMRLAGPTVTAAAVLRPTAGAVLARTAPGGMPLVRTTRHGRGTVCLTAIPLTLTTRRDDPRVDDIAAATGQRDAAWSDIAAWPVFVPLMDRLIDRLAPGLLAGRPGPRRVGGPPGVTGGWRLPLAPAVVAIAILLAIADTLLTDTTAGGVEPRASWLHRGGRIALAVILPGMLVAWSGRLPVAAGPAAAAGSVAFVIDVSPSMAGPVAPAPAPPQSRLDTVRHALAAGGADGDGIGRLARDRDVAIFAAAGGITRLDTAAGGPAGAAWADGVRRLAAVPPAAGASRLGDAVTSVLEGGSDADGSGASGTGRPPAAIVVVSDGVITAGASWSQAARAAAARRVPLVAVPVGDAVADRGTRLPPGFRFTAVRPPRLCRTADAIEIAIEAEAAGGGDAVPVRLWETLPAVGPPLAASLLEWQPTGSGDPPRLAGRLIVPPRGFAAAGSCFRSPVLVAGDPADGGSGAAVSTTIPLAITDAAIEVLLVESSPRFEWRFLERFLVGDPAFAPETTMLAADLSAGLRHAVPLPGGRAAWNRHDVVVLGDVPFNAAGAPPRPPVDGAAAAAGGFDGIAASLTGLREAASIDAVGIAWVPGRRWQEDTTEQPDWLPARMVPGVDHAPTLPRVLRARGTGRAASWLPPVGATTPREPEVFGLRGPLALGPTARVAATAPEQARPASAVGPPAIVIDRLGAAHVLAIFCDTWRWRQADATAWRAFWRHGLERLGEPHLLARHFAATIDVEPPAATVGDVVRITVTPTQATTGLSGWSLAVVSPASAADPTVPAAVVRTIGQADAAGPGSVAVIELAGLPAGVHALRLTPPADPAAGPQPPAGAVSHTLIVAPPTIEHADAPTATTAFEAAALASGGAVVPLDRLDTLPQVLADVLDRPGTSAASRASSAGSAGSAALAASPGSRRSTGTASGVRDHLLLVALIAAAAAAWWPAGPGRRPTEAADARP